MKLPPLTYANVTATLSLILAIGTGGAYAANQLAARSVGAKQLRPGAVTAEKIRQQAIITPKIKAKAVNAAKLAAGAVTESKIGAVAVSSEKLADNAVTTAKLADNSVTGMKIEEASLGQVPSAAKASFATEAEVANPIAFARVDADGSVEGTLARGVSSGDVSQGGEPGIYCVSASGVVPRGAQATPQGVFASSTITALVTVGGTSSCPAPAVEVQMRNGGALTKAPFYVELYR